MRALRCVGRQAPSGGCSFIGRGSHLASVRFIHRGRCDTSQAVLSAGVIGLSSGTPAEAAAFDGCDDYQAAKLDAIRTCQNGGYTKMQSSGWCSSSGYELNYTCS